MPKRSLQDLMAVRSPRPRPAADSADDFSHLTLAMNIAYLPPEEGRVKTLRIKGPGFQYFNLLLRAENPAMFSRPERLDDRSVWNSGWRITWGEAPAYVSAVSWYSSPVEECLAFGAYLTTLINEKIRGVRFWCQDESMTNVLQEQMVPIQDSQVPPCFLLPLFGYPPIQCKLNYTDGPIFLIIRDFARVSPILKDLEWERFTSESGKPGWAKQWSTWKEAHIDLKKMYEQMEKPTMHIDNITKPGDDAYIKSCFFLLHAFRMNRGIITVSADSREKAETIEKMNMSMLSVYTLLRHYQIPNACMTSFKQFFSILLCSTSHST